MKQRYYILIKIAEHRPKKWIEVDLTDFQIFLGELSADYIIQDHYNFDTNEFYANNELRAKIVCEDK